MTFGVAGTFLSGVYRYTMVGDRSSYLRSHFEGFENSCEALWNRVGAVNGEKVSQAVTYVCIIRAKWQKQSVTNTR